MKNLSFKKIIFLSFWAVPILLLVTIFTDNKYKFVLGGAFLNVGYFMQDGIKEYDFENEKSITPAQVVKGLIEQNNMSASVRSLFPRFPYKALVALVICMDSRLDTNEIIGDTRKYYYIIRTAGSVIKEKEEEMLELAVEHGVKVIVLTTHTNCAAKAIANDPRRKEQYPHIARSVENREKDIQEFLARPEIARKIKEGSLIVKHAIIDTNTKKLTMLD